MSLTMGLFQRSDVLMQAVHPLTDHALARQVITGPVEAMAMGNILMQMVTLDRIDSLQAGHQLVCNSFDLSIYKPGSRSGWDGTYAHLLQVISQQSPC